MNCIVVCSHFWNVPPLLGFLGNLHPISEVLILDGHDH